jgi:hypothetical protein
MLPKKKEGEEGGEDEVKKKEKLVSASFIIQCADNLLHYMDQMYQIQ